MKKLISLLLVSLPLILLLSGVLYAQEVRVTNSFIILENNKLATTVAGLKFVLSDTTGKEESIEGGYYAGVLSVRNVESKNVLFGDTVRNLTLVFNSYEYRGGNQIVKNYKIPIDRKWFKESLIIVRIYDINKRRGTYRYTFEVPGYSFGRMLKK